MSQRKDEDRTDAAIIKKLREAVEADRRWDSIRADMDRMRPLVPWHEILRVRPICSKADVHDAWDRAWEEEVRFHKSRLKDLNRAFNEGCEAVKEREERDGSI